MYRVIDTRLWEDDKVRALPKLAKLLFVYYITNPHSHLTGIYPEQPNLFATELGMDRHTYARCRNYLEVRDLVVISAKKLNSFRLLWIKNMFKYQGNPGPKITMYARAYLETLPQCPLIASFYMTYPRVAAIDPKDIGKPDTVRLFTGQQMPNVVQKVPSGPDRVFYQYQEQLNTSTKVVVSQLVNNSEPDPASPEDSSPARATEEATETAPFIARDALDLAQPPQLDTDPPNVVRFPPRDRPTWSPMESFGQILARYLREEEKRA
jgi:hypothetical protein